MIHAITPDQRLWYTKDRNQDRLSPKTLAKLNGREDDQPGPACCWHWCWWYGP